MRVRDWFKDKMDSVRDDPEFIEEGILMIEFTRDELFNIKEEVQGTLESMYIGDYRGKELWDEPVESFEMSSAKVMSLRGILKKVKDVE